ncbi:MarR family transcriptional regulator [Streptomyces longwoodensis]|uniref:MarR family winged helix-turn-helix transcriptional regulator n=1 Tax=Streptomyces longwoodensis TaxID=68231 RepID=UPI0033B7D66C
MDDTLAEDLRRAVGDLVRAARTVDTMPAGEAAVLGHLDRGGPYTTAELAQLRGVTHQSAAKTVKELQGAGLVRAEPHPTDGRKALLHLTDTGRRRLDGERTRRADWLTAAIEDTLSAREQEQLRRCVPLIARLAGRLNER